MYLYQIKQILHIYNDWFSNTKARKFLLRVNGNYKHTSIPPVPSTAAIRVHRRYRVDCNLLFVDSNTRPSTARDKIALVQSARPESTGTQCQILNGQYSTPDPAICSQRDKLPVELFRSIPEELLRNSPETKGTEAWSNFIRALSDQHSFKNYRKNAVAHLR